MSMPNTVSAGPVGEAIVAGITGNDLLAQLNRHTEKLTSIETKVDSLPLQITQLGAHVERHGLEIEELKRWRSFCTGIGAVIVLLLTSGVTASLLVSLHR